METPLFFVSLRSELGETLLAKSEKGIKALFFGEEKSALEKELSRRFSQDKLITDNTLSPYLEKILYAPFHEAYPLDLKGTDFQIKVWETLRAIPYGSLETYSQIAKRIGKEKAVRAVASACGANPISLLIPCHRVIGKTGSLCGYYWGLGKKKYLLAKETLPFSSPFLRMTHR